MNALSRIPEYNLEDRELEGMELSGFDGEPIVLEPLEGVLDHPGYSEEFKNRALKGFREIESPVFDPSEMTPAQHLDPQFEDWAEKGLSAGTIAAELAIGMAPGGDFIDIGYEYFWKVFVKGEDPNHVVGLVAFVGLVADGGYLAGPVGALGNGATSIIKVVVKYTPPGLIKRFFKEAKSVIDFCVMAINRIKHLKTPQADLSTVPGLKKVLTEVGDWIKKIFGMMGRLNDGVESALKKKWGNAVGDEALEKASGELVTETTAQASKLEAEEVTEGAAEGLGDYLSRHAAKDDWSVELEAARAALNTLRESLRRVPVPNEKDGPGDKLLELELNPAEVEQALVRDMDVAAYVKDLKLYEEFEGLDDTAMRGLGSIMQSYSAEDVKRFFDHLASLPDDTDGLEFFLKDGINGANKFQGVSFQAEAMATGRIAEFDIHQIKTLNHRIITPEDKNISGVDAVTNNAFKYWEFQNYSDYRKAVDVYQIDRHLKAMVEDHGDFTIDQFAGLQYSLVMKCSQGATIEEVKEYEMRRYIEAVLPDLDQKASKIVIKIFVLP